MATLKKLGSPQGVAEWQALETTGDVKRFLAWSIHSVRDTTLDARTAATLGQLACYLLKAMETSELERRLAELEARLTAGENHHELGNAPLPH